MDEELADIIRGEKGKIDTERGKSTDRERDLGWLDIPELRTAIKANSVSELFLAKLDWVPKVGALTLIAESYSDSKNKPVMSAPSDSAEIMSEVTPNYIELPTWGEPIGHIREFKDLPPYAQRYIETVEQLVGVPITKIGVGPYRGEFIERPVSGKA
jgi:adenylosuccinate synthase